MPVSTIREKAGGSPKGSKKGLAMKRSAVCCGLRRMPRARHAPLMWRRPGTPMGCGRCLSLSTYACNSKSPLWADKSLLKLTSVTNRDSWSPRRYSRRSIFGSLLKLLTSLLCSCLHQELQCAGYMQQMLSQGLNTRLTNHCPKAARLLSDGRYSYPDIGQWLAKQLCVQVVSTQDAHRGKW